MLYTDATLIEALNEGEDTPETIADPFTGEPAFRVGYEHSDGWRGRHTTEPIVEGWEKVGHETMCGEWADAPPGTRSSEVEARLDAMAEDDDILVIACPTSNVFAMGADVYRRM
jgi:hypothetical protein